MSLGQDNRVSVHIDRFSPLAERKPGRRRGYSARRVIVHNVGIVVDYVLLLFHRRFGEQRCELECERICEDDHELEGDGSLSAGYAGNMSIPDQPPPIPRDLSEDEPDLPSDAELDAMTPPLPTLETDPMDPMPPVAPGPEESRPPIEGAPRPTNTLDEIADAVHAGEFPESHP